MDLFAAQPQRVAGDAEGGIRYIPDVVDPATADAWFAALRDGVRWKSAERPMYDRVVPAKAAGARAVGVELAPGSLLVMSHASQRTHEHGIPKTKAAVGPRISVVFRVRSSVARPYDG